MDPNDMYQMTVETALGPMLIGQGPDGLLGSWFLEQQHFPAAAQNWSERRTDLLDSAASQLQAYLNGARVAFDLPLAVQGTEFQRAVWAGLRTIPYAQTVSYGELARQLGRPEAVRAVGAAIGRNPWSLIVPCHRVVGSDGALTGYAGGLMRKRRLLALENRVSTGSDRLH